MVNPVEMVNGKLQHMSDVDTAAYMANVTFASEQKLQKQIPDFQSQVANLTAAVVALGGTIPDDQLAVANATLEANGQPAISVQSLNNAKIL